MSAPLSINPHGDAETSWGSSSLRWNDAFFVKYRTWLNGSEQILSPLPVGGTAGQVLSKNSNTDYDYTWSSLPSYDAYIKAITGKSTVDATPDASLAALWALSWTEKITVSNPPNGFVTVSDPLSRRGTLSSIDFYVLGTPSAAAAITISQNGIANGQTISLSAAGKTTLTLSTAISGEKDDLFTLTVGSSGLSSCTLLAALKWVNR